MQDAQLAKWGESSARCAQLMGMGLALLIYANLRPGI